MRFTPAALALALLAGVTSSMSHSATPDPLDPRAAALVQQGRTALAAGEVNAAIDAYESALAIQPGHVAIYLNLAEASRKQTMPGKALHYYRQALKADPGNAYAIAGEGVALVEKGAVDKARRNLARLQQQCGSDCAAAQELAAAIAKGPTPQMVAAEQIAPQPTVTPN